MQYEFAPPLRIEVDKLEHLAKLPAFKHERQNSKEWWKSPSSWLAPGSAGRMPGLRPLKSTENVQASAWFADPLLAENWYKMKKRGVVSQLRAAYKKERATLRSFAAHHVGGPFTLELYVPRRRASPWKILGQIGYHATIKPGGVSLGFWVRSGNRMAHQCGLSLDAKASENVLPACECGRILRCKIIRGSIFSEDTAPFGEMLELMVSTFLPRALGPPWLTIPAWSRIRSDVQAPFRRAGSQSGGP